MSLARIFAPVLIGLTLPLAVAAEQADGAAAVNAAPPLGGGSLSDEYRIGVEDVLNVVVWGEEQLSGPATVRPDGKITVPLVSDIKVVGLTPHEVRDKIVAALQDYVRDPNVTVVVQQIQHFRVYFLGEISQQGSFVYQRPVRLLQAIAERGGLTQYANKKITIVREEGGVEKRIPVDYKKLLAGDPSQENLHLKPGDTIIFDN